MAALRRGLFPGVLVASAVALPNCGGSGGEDPYTLTCRDVDDAAVRIPAAQKLAEDVDRPGNRDQIAGELGGQMLVICTSKPPEYKPAQDALDRYRRERPR